MTEESWAETTKKLLKEFDDDQNSCVIITETLEQQILLQKIVKEENYMIEF